MKYGGVGDLGANVLAIIGNKKAVDRARARLARKRPRIRAGDLVHTLTPHCLLDTTQGPWRVLAVIPAQDDVSCARVLLETGETLDSWRVGRLLGNGEAR